MSRGILLALAGTSPSTKHINDLTSQHIPGRVVVQSGNEALPKIFQSRVPLCIPCSGVTVTEMPAPPSPRTVREHKAGRVLREKAGDVLQWRHFKVAAIQLCPLRSAPPQVQPSQPSARRMAVANSTQPSRRPRHERRWLHSRCASHHNLVLDGWRRCLSASL